MKTGYVYLLESAGLYKIGQTTNPDRRLRQLRTGSGAPIHTVTVMRSQFYQLIEAFLHDKYRAARIRGEWFALEPEQVDYIKSFNEDEFIKSTAATS